MKAKLYQLKSLLNKLNSPYSVVLFYGTDEGEIQKGFQQVRSFLTATYSDMDFIQLSSDQLKKNPFFATDEGNSTSLMGGHRTLVIEEDAGFNEKALIHFVDNRKTDALLIIKAGNLPKNSSLRQESEQNPFVLAFACYPPTEAELQNTIISSLTAAKKTLAPDALKILTQKLSMNAGIIEQELAKLLLFIGDKKNISIEDIFAVITDSSETSYDSFCIALADGNTKLVERYLYIFFSQNEPIFALIKGLTGYFYILSKLTESNLHIENKEKILTKELKANQFKLKDPLLKQAGFWTQSATSKVLNELRNLECNTRKTGMPENVLFAHTCLKLSEYAKKLACLR